jgi:hypothetical protein
VQPATLITSPFRRLAELRHARVFHPDGVLCTGTASLTGDAPLPLAGGPVTARISKGIGLPGSWPDIVGLAVRLPDGSASHWDLLLAGPAPLGGRIPLPLPSRRWVGSQVSSLTPYRHDGTLYWIRGRFLGPQDLPGLDLDRLRTAITTGSAAEVTIEVSTGTDAFVPVMHLRLDAVCTGLDVDFDPILHLPPSVDFAPEWLGSLRRKAYRGSRAGRPHSAD